MKPNDLRTRSGRKTEIINQIKEHGGFSIFWITENYLRAVVASDMLRSNQIRVQSKAFPWMDVSLMLNAKFRDTAGT